MQLNVLARDWDKIYDKNIIIPLFSDTALGADHPEMPDDLKTLIEQMQKLPDFEAKKGQVAVLYPAKARTRRFILLGLGKLSDCDGEVIRESVGKVVKKLRGFKETTATIIFPKLDEAKLDYISFCKALSEGLIFSNYEYNVFKTKEDERKPFLESVELFVPALKLDELKAATAETSVIGHAANNIRNLVNGCAYEVTPQRLVDEANAIAKQHGMKCTVLDKKQMKKQGLGLILAVSSGNEIPPYLIIMEHNGDASSDEKTAVVGKGITFDTGGLGLKPGGAMDWMRADMGGAAAVLGVMKAVGELKLKKNVIGVIPACENAIGGNAYKPGDIFKAYNGMTVQIGHTDAEGRLILADALAYVCKNYEPSTVIDMATLTGAVITCLGREAAAVLSRDDALREQLIAAGEKCGERLWPLPLWDGYKKMMKNDFADICNIQKPREAGTIVGAIFLENFVENAKFAHLDIAGMAFFEKAMKYFAIGGTGFGVRVLVEYLKE